VNFSPVTLQTAEIQHIEKSKIAAIVKNWFKQKIWGSKLELHI